MLRRPGQKAKRNSLSPEISTPKKNYPLAAEAFEQCIGRGSSTADVYYYGALANQQCGRFNRARQLFQYVLSAYPRSREAEYARLGLMQLGVGLGGPKTKAADKARGSNAGDAEGPTPGANVRTAGEQEPKNAIKNDAAPAGAASVATAAKSAAAVPAGAGAKTAGGNQADSEEDERMGTEAAFHSTKGTKNLQCAPSDFKKPSDFAALPDQARVYFERKGSHVYVQPEVNGRATAMLLDTGAPVTAMNIETFESLGGSAPAGEPEGTVSGVGGQRFPAWTVRTTLRLGVITRYNFPLLIVANPKAESLLGQTFLGPYEFTIDAPSGTITFSKIGSGKSSAARVSASLSVPFSWQGQHIIVAGRINGKSHPCIFDTGADVCMMSKKSLAELGMSIPAGAVMSRAEGYGGASSAWIFDLDSISLGPITKKNIAIYVAEDASIDEPLLGQSFFGDYQYTVDNEHKLIHFVRK